MQFTKSRSQKAADRAHDLVDSVKERLDDSDTLTQVKETVAERAHGLKETLAETDAHELAGQARQKAADAAEQAKEKAAEARRQAAERAEQARQEAKARAKDAKKQARSQAKDAKKAAAQQKKDAKKTAAKGGLLAGLLSTGAAAKVADTVQDSDALSAARAKAQDAAGMTREQAHRMFEDEWMPRLQQALSAATAAASTQVARLPEPAQQQVARVAPELVKKRRKGGKLFITLGLACLAGAGYLYWQEQQKAAGSGTDPFAAGSTTGPQATAGTGSTTVETVETVHTQTTPVPVTAAARQDDTDDTVVGDNTARVEQAIAGEVEQAPVSQVQLPGRPGPRVG